MSGASPGILAILNGVPRTANRPAAPRGNAKAFIVLFACSTLMNTAALAVPEGCKLYKLAEFPVTVVGLQPMTTATINGTEVRFVIDSGAFYSMLSESNAKQLNLKLSAVPPWFSVTGVHGGARVAFTNVQTLTVAGVALHDVDFFVGGSEFGQDAIGVLGQNLLHFADVEYDLGQGVVRLAKPQDCSKTVLAYWAGPSTTYSVMDLLSEPPMTGASTGSHIPPTVLQLSHTLGRAYVNGTEIRVMFDTGTGVSILSLNAAARAGITPDSPGVVSAGSSYGIGRDSFATYIAPFSSFKIAGEEIRNTRLRIGDIRIPGVDMLIGADFFLAHRVYVANSQQKLYFTYNGGPVFNLSTDNRARNATAAETAAPEPGEAGSATEDAADYGRRAAAFASRGDLDHALTALNRACELAPGNPEYLYLRGEVHWSLKQPSEAMEDFNRALKMKPEDSRARIARAQLLLDKGDSVAAVADLDAADAALPKAANLRFDLGNEYGRADQFGPAVAQLTLWMDSHGEDARLPAALNHRCWFRALAGVDLPLALKDCNAALSRLDKSNPNYSHTLDSRALVYLRLGEIDKSIADYDAVLKVDPRNAWSLYGRGIAKLRKQQTTAGAADIADAKSVRPEVAEVFKLRGITPPEQQ